MHTGQMITWWHGSSPSRRGAFLISTASYEHPSLTMYSLSYSTLLSPSLLSLSCPSSINYPFLDHPPIPAPHISFAFHSFHPSISSLVPPPLSDLSIDFPNSNRYSPRILFRQRGYATTLTLLLTGMHGTSVCAICQP